MKEYNLKQSVVIVIVGLALLWACLYCFVFPFLAGGGPGKVPRARVDESQLGAGMEEYKSIFGNYPTGENASVVRTLVGDNPKKLRLFNLGVDSTNKNGELIDPFLGRHPTKLFLTVLIASPSFLPVPIKLLATRTTLFSTASQTIL